MEREQAELLKHIPIFTHLDTESLKRISPLVAYHRFREKQVIYMPSDPRTRLCAILTGRVKLTQLSPEGKELVLCVLGRGDVFGELCLFDEGPHSTLATALEDAEIITIKCSDLGKIMAEDPSLVAAMGKHVGERIRSLEQKLSDFVFKDVPQRLAGLLVEMALDYGEQQQSGEYVVEMKITHQELAGLIGSTRETTTVTLNQFRDDGLIDFQRGRIVVRSLEGLKHLANAHSKKPKPSAMK